MLHYSFNGTLMKSPDLFDPLRVSPERFGYGERNKTYRFPAEELVPGEELPGPYRRVFVPGLVILQFLNANVMMNRRGIITIKRRHRMWGDSISSEIDRWAISENGLMYPINLRGRPILDAVMGYVSRPSAAAKEDKRLAALNVPESDQRPWAVKARAKYRAHLSAERPRAIKTPPSFSY